MVTLSVDQNRYACQQGETVLDALLRQNINLSFACKKGTCHSCMVRSADVTPPQAAQSGLKNTLIKQNYFLACQCYPEQDMVIKGSFDQKHGLYQATPVGLAIRGLQPKYRF